MKKTLAYTFLAVSAAFSALWTGCSSNDYNSPTSPQPPTATYTPTGPTSTPTNSPTITMTPTITNTPTITLTPTITRTPTVTGTPTPRTITVTTASSGLSSTGFIYASTGFTNGAGGVLNLTARVGDTIMFPASSTHPLRFDAGSSTCIYAGVTSNQSYAVTGTGTFYFHCQNHASGCSLSACGSTSCSAMAGVLTVSP